MTVDDVKKELNYDKYVGQLKAVKNYWRKLMALELAAKKDVRQLDRYRAFLEQGINSASGTESKRLTDDQIAARVLKIAAKFNDTFVDNHGDDKERDRGMCMAAWMAKWNPKEHKAFTSALADVMTDADVTEASLDLLESAATDYMSRFTA